MHVLIDLVYSIQYENLLKSRKVRDHVSDCNIGEDVASPEEMEKALRIMGCDTEDAANGWVNMGGFSIANVIQMYFSSIQMAWNSLVHAVIAWQKEPAYICSCLMCCDDDAGEAAKEGYPEEQVETCALVDWHNRNIGIPYIKSI